MNVSSLKKLKIPDSSGVYLFKKNYSVLYVGKATSLRNRVKSYFGKDIIKTRGQLIQKMVGEAGSVDYIKTDSVLEALILEANLIKKFQPRYNTKEKDDKSFNYVVITKEDFPRVLVIRGKDLESTILSNKIGSYNIKHLFGPFPHGGIFKNAMKIIRRLFPFRDICTPCNIFDKDTDCKQCFNRQIGLCPGVCSGEISKTEYNRTIKHIKLFFEGKKRFLIKALESDMKAYADKKEFEKAQKVKKTIFGLKHIQDVSLIKDDFKNALTGRISNGSSKGDGYRIEAYDISHTSGVNTVGAMVVAEGGSMKKTDYRKFNIINRFSGNDIKSLEELLYRRLKHTEWKTPDLVVVDGGKAQINVAKKVLGSFYYEIPVVGVVKDDKHKPKMIIGDKKAKAEYEKEILLTNAEAHRFALSFHRKKFSFK